MYSDISKFYTDRHEAGRFVDQAVSDHVLFTLLPHFDVQQQQCVETSSDVGRDLWVETVGAPFLKQTHGIASPPTRVKKIEEIKNIPTEPDVLRAIDYAHLQVT